MSVQDTEARIDEIETELIRREHRSWKVFWNLWLYNKNEMERRHAARMALIFWFISPATIAMSSISIISIIGLYLAWQANSLLEKQNEAIEVQTIAVKEQVIAAREQNLLVTTQNELINQEVNIMEASQTSRFREMLVEPATDVLLIVRQRMVDKQSANSDDENGVLDSQVRNAYQSMQYQSMLAKNLPGKKWPAPNESTIAQIVEYGAERPASTIRSLIPLLSDNIGTVSYGSLRCIEQIVTRMDKSSINPIHGHISGSVHLKLEYIEISDSNFPSVLASGMASSVSLSGSSIFNTGFSSLKFKSIFKFPNSGPVDDMMDRIVHHDLMLRTHYAPIHAAEFDNCVFADCDFSEVNYYGIKFNKCVFQGAVFNKSIMSGIKFNSCIFMDCEFIDIQLEEVVFSRSYFKQNKSAQVVHNSSEAVLCRGENNETISLEDIFGLAVETHSK